MARLKYELRVDEEFKRLIPPLSLDERKQLEEDIVKDGCREPLCVWNNTILDGHNRYEICMLMGTPFSIIPIFLKNREDAIAWICANQLGRHNISEQFRRYLIGKRYEAEKKAGSRSPAGINQHSNNELWYKSLTKPLLDETNGRTRERLGDEYNISHHTVARYWDYAKAIDSLTQVDPELTSKILYGEAKMTHEDILTLSQLSPTDIKNVASRIINSPKDAVKYIRMRQEIKPKRQSMKSEIIPNPTVAIKETPAYDPDASAVSLILTIPSWISAIERTAIETDYHEITSDTCINLKNALKKLIETAQTTLDTNLV